MIYKNSKEYQHDIVIILSLTHRATFAGKVPAMYRAPRKRRSK